MRTTIKWLLRCLLGVFWAVAAEPLPVTAAPPQLLQAYKKEFAFLQAQKRAMGKRLKALNTIHKRRVASAETTLRKMQAQLMWRREATQAIARQLQATGQVQTRHDERKQLLDKVMSRAGYALSQGGLPLAKRATGSKPSASSLLQDVFTKGATLLQRAGQTSIRKGHFFLADGTRVKGKIVQVGGIASYGISPQGTGALAPAGAGRRKLWPQDARATATALLQQQHPPQLRIFLYESLRKEIAFRAEKSLVAFIHSGGIIGWVIVGLGLLAALLVLLRSLILVWAGAGSQRLFKSVDLALHQGQQDQALARCQSSRGPGARVLEQTLVHIDKDRAQLEELVAESILQEAPRIERFGSMIMVIAAIAPLLGLLGTVTGMISTFDVITQFGTGDPKLLAGGISEALITTKLGLIVAIPALLLGTLLSGRAEAVLHQMEWGALRLMNVAQLQRAEAHSADSLPQVEAEVAVNAEVGSSPAHQRHPHAI